jgi:WD40 repeat protein
MSPEIKAPEVNVQHPWLGLLPYKEEHRDFFFGRDREIEDILGRIRDNSLTILYGQSGLGKSSLLAAGVVPHLKENGFTPRIIRLSFGQRATLREQMLAALPIRSPFIRTATEPSWVPWNATLWELFHRKTNVDSEQSIPVLIFDQFEEIFTLGAEPKFEQQVADWLEQMADLLQNRPPRHLAEAFSKDPALAEQYQFGDAPVRIVFTLREDYLANLERWKAQMPLLMQNRMALTLLSGPQARQAVLGPAQLGDHSLVTREVAESIVRAVVGKRDGITADTPLDQIKAVPPLLSLICEQLNVARLSYDSLQITADMVRDQADDILQRFYVESFDVFPPQHRSVIRALIEDPPMITEGGFRNSLVRDDAQAQLTRAGVPDAKAVFDTLIQRRLITSEERDRVQRMEVTHDVLVPMLLRSRKERQDREAKEKAERAASAAKAEQERLAQERRRLRIKVIAMAALALIAAGFAVYGWWQAKLALHAEGVAKAAEIKASDSLSSAKASAKAAEEARRKAQAAADQEKVANEKNLRTLHEASMADYALATQRIEKENKWHEGVAHLARSLKWEPTNSLAAARLYSTLALHAAEKQTWPREILRHEASVSGAQFSPDGMRIVTASDDKTARVWDAASGKPLGEPLRHEDRVLTAQFSPDGTLIVTASDDTTARVWDAASGKPVSEPLRHEDSVSGAQFSPDGTRIVTETADNTARVWDVASGKPLGEPLRHEDSVRSAQFSLDGTRIVTASWDKTARVWDAASGKPLGEPLRHEAIVLSAQFSLDGTRIVTANWDKTARVWDAASGKPLGEPLRHDGGVLSAQFSPDGTLIVTASDDTTARVWDTASGKPVSEPLRHEASVWSAQFSPDGTRIVTASADKTAREWDVARGKPFGEPLRHEDRVLSAQFSPDGSRIVTASEDGTAQVWDAASGKPLGEPLRHDSGVLSAQFSPDGSRIVTASWNKTARVWDVASGKPLDEPLRHDGGVLSAQFSPDGSRIVTASSDNTAWVWDVARGKPLGEPLRHEDRVLSAQFSPDGARIVTASEDGTAQVWDAARGKPLGEPLRHDSGVLSAHFSPDGTRIVTASWDKTARVWDVASGKPLGDPLRHEAIVLSAQFSLDGMRIVTANADDTARLWDVASGKPLGEPLRHEDRVLSAQFSPDGSRIVTASWDNTARVWDAKVMLHVPVPVPEWMPQCAWAIAGLNFDTDGEMNEILAEQRISVLTAAVPSDDTWAKLARWQVLPANERTQTPDSKFTFRQIAERERDSGFREGLEAALRYDPTVPLARLLLAQFEGNPQRAAFLRDYDLKRLPANAALWARASTSLTEQKTPKLALQAAQKAVSLDANLPAAVRSLVKALLADDQQEAAVAAYESLIARGKAELADFLDAGYLAAKLHLADRSKAIFQQAEARFPDDESIAFYAGWSFINLDDPSAALAAFQRTRSLLKPEEKPDTDLLAGLALAQWLNQKQSDAITTYKQLIETGRSQKKPTDWAAEDTIRKMGWPDAEAKPMEQLRKATLAKHPELTNPPPLDPSK